MNNKEIGALAEEEALLHLANKGHILKVKNYRYGAHEIDLITQDGDFLVFTEVKYRSTDKFGFPEYSVNYQKKRAIQRVAQQYIYKINWLGIIRFDIIAILKKNEAYEFEHIVDAF